MRRILAAILLNLTLLASVSHALADEMTFVVNTTDDTVNDGCDATHCTLREAILAANANAGADTIEFDIAGTAPYTITPGSALPDISEVVTIDGTTEPDYVGPNPVIEINGGTPSNYPGLLIYADSTVIRGLAINRFSWGIKLNGVEDALIENNFLGINPAGTAASANNYGIVLERSNLNTIRNNVISGNVYDGLLGTNDNVTPSAKSDENTIVGNLIGTDVTGLLKVPNGSAGITLSGNLNVVGGLTAADRNVISGNTIGVQLLGTGNQVMGNYIGTDITGAAILSNRFEGVRIQGDDNVVGGSVAGSRNIISGNGFFEDASPQYGGVLLTTSTGTIEGNYIGTDVTGTIDLGNAKEGITVDNGASATITGNVISGNGTSGILITRSDAVVAGNYIGTNAAGTAALGNSGNGVTITGVTSTFTSATIGTGNEADRNIISGNAFSGVSVNILADDIVDIMGNYIGLNAAGDAAIGNTLHGVTVAGEGAIMICGGNVISGNTGNGVRLSNGGNLVDGNYIGTDATGTVDLGNGSHGVYVVRTSVPETADGNIIGGIDPADRNVISGNNGAGVYLAGYSAAYPISNTLIGANYIGLNAAGDAAIGNSQDGIHLSNVADSLVGDEIAGAGNVISGNGSQGVEIQGGSAIEFYGNYIGTDASGTVDLGNFGAGVSVVNGTDHLLGELSEEGINVISGNGGYGITISSTDTIVQNNLIGTDVTGLEAIPNDSGGVSAAGSGVLIGGTAFTGEYYAGNIISGNTGYGVLVGANSIVDVYENLIGLNADGEPLGNSSHGVAILGDDTWVIDNVIAYNGEDGIAIYPPGFGQFADINSLLGNYIFENGGIGIDLGNDGVTPNDADDEDSGANDLLNYPIITSAQNETGGVRLTGQLIAPPSQTYYVQVYANTTCDPSGYGEGEEYLGFFLTATNSNGIANFNTMGPFEDVQNKYITLLTSDEDGNVSEFSPCSNKVTLFADVPTPGREFMQPFIELFYELGITTGCNTAPLSYCPEQPVTRAAMSVFLLRALNYPNLPYDPADTEPDIFADVPVAGKEWMEPWVEEFYNLGITGGCGQAPLRFCPEQSVTRAAMAVFILRALEGPDYQPDPSPNIFADLPVAGKEWMEPWVNEFYDRGFTTGCNVGPLRYCPENPVTRGAMAVFILRAFDNLPEP